MHNGALNNLKTAAEYCHNIHDLLQMIFKPLNDYFCVKSLDPCKYIRHYT